MSAGEAAEIFKCDWVSPPQEPFPPEAEGNWNHLFWDFLDQTDYSKLPVSPMGQMKFREIIP
jgi:hypothetical protein